MADEPLFIVESVTGCQIRLTPTIWRKIEKDHPEFEGRGDYADEIRNVISDPAYIVEGWEGADVLLRWCESAPESPKYLAVVFRELNGEGFVITAFFVSRHERLLKRGVKWQRK